VAPSLVLYGTGGGAALRFRWAPLAAAVHSRPPAATSPLLDGWFGAVRPSVPEALWCSERRRSSSRRGEQQLKSDPASCHQVGQAAFVDAGRVCRWAGEMPCRVLVGGYRGPRGQDEVAAAAPQDEHRRGHRSNRLGVCSFGVVIAAHPVCPPARRRALRRGHATTSRCRARARSVVWARTVGAAGCDGSQGSLVESGGSSRPSVMPCRLPGYDCLRRRAGPRPRRWGDSADQAHGGRSPPCRHTCPDMSVSPDIPQRIAYCHELGKTGRDSVRQGERAHE